MIVQTGKDIAQAVMEDGGAMSFFNFSRQATMVQETVYVNPSNQIAYRFTPDDEFRSSAVRCLQFTNVRGWDAQVHVRRMVIWDKTRSDTMDKPASPLYEAISPSLFNYEGTYTIAWWSNVDDYGKLQKAANGGYEYDPSLLHKFTYSTLGSETVTESAGIILCVGMVSFQMLKQSGGGVEDKRVMWYPVVMNVNIQSLITGEGFVVDFAGGGDGSGKSGMHSHLSTADCGYAAGVYMPSAVKRQINWY